MSDPSSVGTATVNGQVWLDNNGDDNFDDGEMDFSGITVNLWSGGAVVATTTTNANTSGNNYQLVVNSVPPAGGQYEVEVLFLSGDDTTTEGSECQVAPDDFSDAFFLAPGGAANINAGANSLKVNTTADDAAGAIVQNQITLRDAIETANNPLRADPTINFSPGVNGEIQLIDDLPALDNDITINGPGMNVLAIVGSVFSIESGNTCAINNLTIEGGSGYLDGGGGVYNAGDLTLASDAITGNTAVSNGGGIYNATDSDLNLISSAVFNNTSLGYGGGIMNYGTLSICCNSQIYSNTAYNGGGLANFLLGKAEIYDNTVISNNKANDPNGGVGGGIYNSGDITMSAGGINNNTATYGGGVFVTGGTVTLTKGVFISNNKASSGGGIYIKSGNVKMSRGTISTNQAIVGTGKGGGIYVNGGSLTLTDGVLISHNKSLKNGGGIYINGGNATLSGGTLRFNSVQGAFNGGGIYNAAGTLTLNGGVYVGTENSAQQGGGMYLAADSRTNFNGVTVSGNVASNGGTGVYEQNGATVNPDPPKPPALNDPDDSGNLVKGP